MNESLPFAERVRASAQHLQERGVDALSALYDLAAARLVRFAVAITQNQHDAEDAVQSVLVRVGTRPSLLNSANCPWQYLLGMVRNEALAIARRKRRYSLLASFAEFVTRQPPDRVESEDQRQLVWRALRSLPPPQAEVVALKVWENLTFAQIAEITQTSANTAASRYRYALRKLAGTLATLQTEVHDV